MTSRVRPRFLSLLRIEDQVVALPEALPVSDAGRIGRWGDFVDGLAVGEVRVERRADGTSLVGDAPDLVTIDFRFNEDTTVPEMNGIVVDGEVLAWSQKLVSPNAGVLIGATLQGIYHAVDTPCVALLHTGVPGDTSYDVSTVLLVGQMLAASRISDGSEAEESTFHRAARLFHDLPESAPDAVRRGIGIYRKRLENWLGVGEAAFLPPRLLVDPEQLLLALSAIKGTGSPGELNECLGKVGLAFWDRSNRYDFLDLRSLFLDQLDGASATDDCPWGLLPTSVVRSFDARGKPVDGLIVEFLERIQQSVGCHFDNAAQYVLHNLTTAKKSTLKLLSSPGEKLLALVFACAECWIEEARKQELALLDMGLAWDAIADRSVPATGRTSLSTKLSQSLLLLESLPDLLDGRGPWKIASHGKSIAKGLIRYRETYPRAALLDELFAAGVTVQDRERGLANLYAHLCSIGAVEQTKDGYRAIWDSSQWDSMKREIANHYGRVRIEAVRLTRDQVAPLLGYHGGITTQLQRPVAGAGYPNPAEFVNRLLAGDVPPHLGRATGWYLSTYRQGVPRNFWPTWARSWPVQAGDSRNPRIRAARINPKQSDGAAAKEADEP
jgi:hypothetical protein